MSQYFPSIYLDRDSGVHRCDARLKLCTLIIYSVCLFFVDTWVGMLAFAAMFFIIMCAAHINAKRMLIPLVPAFIIVAFTLLGSSFAWDGTALVYTAEGFSRGLFIAVRIILLLGASFILCYTTRSTDLTTALCWYLSPLRTFKVPIDDIAMVFSLALRFIPLTAEEFFSIKEAQWSRGALFDQGGVICRVKAYSAIILPLLVGMFRRAETVARCMDVRCYGLMRSVVRTTLPAEKSTILSRVCCCVLCALCLMGAVIL